MSRRSWAEVQCHGNVRFSAESGEGQFSSYANVEKKSPLSVNGDRGLQADISRLSPARPGDISARPGTMSFL